MIKTLSDLYGRQVSQHQIKSNLLNNNALCKRQAIQKNRHRWRCQRCNSLVYQTLPNGQYYCHSCIQLGRLTTTDQLVSLPEPNMFHDLTKKCEWQGTLTSQQEQAAQEVLLSIQSKNSRLLWAVTGAGKTEMLFPGLTWALTNQLRVGIVSPRIDVILELAPRLQSAFPQQSFIALYGDTAASYQYTQLVLATVHQLYRFYHAFDVLIVDEVDVFPLAGNEQLHFALSQAAKDKCAQIFLTATPSPALIQKVQRQQLAVSYLPRRFHGYPLPTITFIKTAKWRQKLQQYQLPKRLVKEIKRLMQIKRPFLLFVPHVKDLSDVKQALEKLHFVDKYATVHATDKNRAIKVQQMRNHELNFLVTTTILERGVNFADIDVLVLGADDEVFSTAALVQMAGRVGRKKSRPTGQVLFFGAHLVTNIRRANAQIKMMNRRAHPIE